MKLFVLTLTVLASSACGLSHESPDASRGTEAAANPSEDGGAGRCDLDSVLSCGACDNPCHRNERCIDRGCVPNALQVSLGRTHILVRMPDGLVRALGAPVPPGILSEREVDALEWTVVRELEGAALPAYSSWHVCVEQDGAASCWGDNSELQLGVAVPSWSRESVQPALPLPIRSVAVGPSHSCAVDIDHGVHCWGSNAEEALWEDSMTTHSLPVQMLGREGTRLELGTGLSCLVDLEGHLECFGRNATVRWPNTMPDHTRVARVFTRGCVCPIYIDGRAACSGCPSPELTLMPEVAYDEVYYELTFLESPVIDVALGQGFYALRADGEVLAWGEASRLGPHIAGAGYESAGVVGPLAVPVPAMTTLACVWEFCCGVTLEQELWCWGHRDAAGGALWPAGSTSSEWNLGHVPLP